ncbi:MAG: CRISPR-associated endonuclease Cas2 [Verrucomicrobia bacterium]|nr:CRISPR-associated endonuclease Cas2 [Verrucomicrobiota bacterium]
MATSLSVKKFILGYDIPEDRLRTRLARFCERFGVRVQYSVFEFRLTESDYVAFRGELDRGGWLNGKHALLIYPLHDDDLENVERHGAVRVWQATFEFL